MASFAEAYAAVRDGYRRSLGRDPESSRVVEDWLGGDYSPESISRVLAGIDASEEANAYRARQGETSNTMPIGGGNNPPATIGVQPTITQGFTPRHAFEGFAFDREQNTGKSAKDAFASLANAAPPPPIHDKQALAAWFRQHIEPGMNALGHRVSSVDGDTFRFSNWQGDFTVDYGRGAGAQGGALAWQVDPGTARMPDNPVYTPQAPARQTSTRAPQAPLDTNVTVPGPSAPPPPADVPMSAMAARMEEPLALRDAQMAAMAAQAPEPRALDDIPMSELARARAARLRGLQWRPEAMI